VRAKQSQCDGTVFQLLWVVALTWMAVAVTSCGTPSTRMRSTYDQGSLCKSSTHEAGVWPRDHERKLYYNACPYAANALCVMKYILCLTVLHALLILNWALQCSLTTPHRPSQRARAPATQAAGPPEFWSPSQTLELTQQDG